MPNDGVYARLPAVKPVLGERACLWIFTVFEEKQDLQTANASCLTASALKDYYDSTGHYIGTCRGLLCLIIIVSILPRSKFYTKSNT